MKTPIQIVSLKHLPAGWSVTGTLSERLYIVHNREQEDDEDNGPFETARCGLTVGEWTICQTCRGDGSICQHLSSSLVEETMRDDDEFRRDYLNGVYDKLCTDCRGTGKYKPLILDPADPSHDAVSEKLQEDWQSAYEDRCMAAMEARCL